MNKAILLIFCIICTIILPAQEMPLKEAGSDDEAVKAVVESFLTAAGNYDIDAIPPLFSENANIGGAVLKNGEWNSFAMSLDEFLEVLRSKANPAKYTEPVSKYTIHTSEGMMAFVKADATLLIDGKPKTFNFDYFTLIKLDGEWKIINGSYVAIPVEEDQN